MRNLRLAFRTLAKTPFVSLVAILSLALGLGANSAIFSLFNQILLRPLPVPEPEALVNLGAPGPKPGSTSCNQSGDCDQVFSYPMFRDLERVQASFTGIAAHRNFSANVAFGGQTESGRGVLVSGSYFPVLGIQPAAGRLFAPEDDQTPGRSSSRGPQPRLLAPPIPGKPRGAGPDPHRQRAWDDHCRRDAARLRRHHARASARRCSCRSPCAPRCSPDRRDRLREPASDTGCTCSRGSSRASPSKRRVSR